MKNDYMNLRQAALAAGIIGGAVLMASCGRKEKDKGTAVPEIEVACPVIDSVTLHKTYPGMLSASTSVDVVGRVNGQLLTQNYTSGQHVDKGMVLYTIEDSKYRDAVTQATASLATAESQLEYARRNYDAMRKALESDAVSQMEVTQAKASMEQAEASVNNARAALSTARTNLGYCVVHAPISGYIDSPAQDPGAYIGGEGSPVTMTRIYNDEIMVAVFSIEDSQYERMLGANGGLKAGMYRAVPLTFNVKMPHQYTSDLFFESPSVSTTTGTLKLKGKVGNPYRELKDGMYVNVSLPYGTEPHAVLISDASIGTDQLGKYVYVVNDSNRVVYTPIKVGELVRDSLRIVESGLRPEDRYVTKALLSVRGGAEVKPVMREQ